MKLVAILKYTFYTLMVLYIMMTISNPIVMYDLLGGFGTKAYTNLLCYGTLTGIAGIIICFNGARILKSFEEKTFSFQIMSNSFKWIGLCLLIALGAYTILYSYLTEALDEAFFVNTIDNILYVGLLGVFFLAISQIIKKAEYYKNENDLTV